MAAEWKHQSDHAPFFTSVASDSSPPIASSWNWTHSSAGHCLGLRTSSWWGSTNAGPAMTGADPDFASDPGPSRRRLASSWGPTNIGLGLASSCWGPTNAGLATSSWLPTSAGLAAGGFDASGWACYPNAGPLPGCLLQWVAGPEALSKKLHAGPAPTRRSAILRPQPCGQGTRPSDPPQRIAWQRELVSSCILKAELPPRMTVPQMLHRAMPSGGSRGLRGGRAASAAVAPPVGELVAAGSPAAPAAGSSALVAEGGAPPSAPTLPFPFSFFFSSSSSSPSLFFFFLALRGPPLVCQPSLSSAMAAGLLQLEPHLETSKKKKVTLRKKLV